jgi:hypothetical protein
MGHAPVSNRSGTDSVAERDKTGAIKIARDFLDIDNMPVFWNITTPAGTIGVMGISENGCVVRWHHRPYDRSPLPIEWSPLFSKHGAINLIRCHSLALLEDGRSLWADVHPLDDEELHTLKHYVNDVAKYLGLPTDSK